MALTPLSGVTRNHNDLQDRTLIMLSMPIMGIILGLSAGFAPGPLLTLVISETLQHDIRSGIKVALAPMITDLPIVVFSLFILTKLSNFHEILGAISLTGGIFIIYIGYESLLFKGIELNLKEKKPRSLAKGILANALSPHPYLFWISVGGPIMIKAMNLGIVAPAIFIVTFYSLLVGSKIILAILVGKYKSLLRGNAYIYTIRFLGAILWVLAISLFYDGLEVLGII